MTQAVGVQPDWDDQIDGPAALVTLAPAVAEAMEAFEAAVWSSDAAPFLGQAAAVCEATLGLRPRTPQLTRPSRATEAALGPEPALDEFAEQFCMDVAATSDGQRAALIGVLGATTGPFVQGLYVLDFFTRARAALDALFPPAGPPSAGPRAEISEITEGPSPGGTGATPTDLWELSMAFLRSVAVLGDLDPVTAELVRLRGASQHQCRLCRSLRNRTAIAAGADDDLFAAVDTDWSVLTEAQQAALALADAMIWTPRHLPPAAIENVRRHFSPPEAVALVLWITRNASNKIAVALAADAPHVEEGIEIYDLDVDGEPVYGDLPG